MGQLPPPNAKPFLPDGRRCLSNPRGLDRWRAKLAAARYNQACIVCAGDSIALGAYSNDLLSSDDATWRVRGWPPQLRSLFADRYGDPGEGVIYPSADDSRVTVSGGATISSSSSVGAFKRSASVNGNAQIVSWSLPACTDIVIYAWWDQTQNTKAYEYRVDGGAWTASTASSGSDRHYSFAITGLSDTTHTLDIRGNSAGGSVINAVGAYKMTTSGVAVHRVAYSGKMLKDFTTLFDGSSTTAIRSIRSSTQAYGADLVILAFSANNVTQGYNVYALTPAQVAAGHALVIDQIITDGACVLCLGGPWRDPASYSIPYTQQEYDDAIRAVCTARTHAAYLDAKLLWGSFDDGDAAGFYIDTIHPKLLGHSDIARFVFEAIGGH